MAHIVSRNFILESQVVRWYFEIASWYFVLEPEIASWYFILLLVLWKRDACY